MFRTLHFKNLIIFCFLGTLVYLLQFFNVKLPLSINNYLNDFLIIPIVLSLSLLVLRLIRKDSSFTISIAIILYVFFFYSVFFEYYMPKISTRYTSDIVDVLMYFFGSVWFWILQKKNRNKKEF